MDSYDERELTNFESSVVATQLGLKVSLHILEYLDVLDSKTEDRMYEELELALKHVERVLTKIEYGREELKENLKEEANVNPGWEYYDEENG